MEKILLAIDPLHPNATTLDWACHIAKINYSRLTGVFLEDAAVNETLVARQFASYANEAESEVVAETRTSRQIIDKNIFQFKEACIHREVSYYVHRDNGVPIDAMIKESRFADLLIVDADTSFNDQVETAPNTFLKKLLYYAECPVIIAPAVFSPIEEVVFTYDGSAASVFAIKQFAYLFPHLLKGKVTVIQVYQSGDAKDPEKHKLSEWLKAHCDNVGFDALKGNADDCLLAYAATKENMVLVMGAYGRSALSRFFVHSHADQLIGKISQPIFIAHT